MSNDAHVILPSGTYVVAVSGGVDSVVLLDRLVEAHGGRDDVKFVVAHVDHGIRSESADDAQFVANLARSYGLVYEQTELHLGAAAGEAEARDARYAFLRRVQRKHKAAAVITAHHEDDVIETGMINLLRGTGRHGLTSLKSREGLLRPLLGVPKADLRSHAAKKGLQWREDATNADLAYTRNRLRHTVVARMTDEQRASWLAYVRQAEQLNAGLDRELDQLLRRGLHKGRPVINRAWFRQLPHVIAREVVVALLRRVEARDIDRRTVERLVVAIKVLPHGKVVEAIGAEVRLSKRSAHFVTKAKR